MKHTNHLFICLVLIGLAGFGVQFGLFWLLRKGYHFSLNEKHALAKHGK